MKLASETKHTILLYLLLTAVTLIALQPVLRCDFVQYDDDRYVTENPHVQQGLTGKSLVWAITKPHYHMWHPVTTISYLLDYELFRLKPFGYHLVNLLIHLANVLLLFTVLRKMTAAIWPSAFIAAVFAVHPLQVESVAWISERKNVLAAFFMLLTLMAYRRYAMRPSLGRYLAVFAAMCMALMSKPTAVVTPVILLLLDYWPLDRLGRAEKSPAEPASRSRISKGCKATSVATPAIPQCRPMRLLAEKVPLFAAAAMVAVVTFLSQHSGGIVIDSDKVAFGYRLANALISYAVYLQKLFWPGSLAVFYPHPGTGFSRAALAISIPVLLGISVWCVRRARRDRYLIAGWLWYVLMLVPVIGLIQAGAQARADRYMYLSMIGPLIIVAFTASKVLNKYQPPRILSAFAGIIVVALLGAAARVQASYWRDSYSLFEHAVNVTENNFVMHNNYGNILRSMGRTDEAISHYRECLQIMPDSVEARVHLGNAIADKGDLKGAISLYGEAIEQARGKPVTPRRDRMLGEACYNLATAQASANLHSGAIENFDESLRLRPGDIDTMLGRARSLTQTNQLDDALRAYKEILQTQPGNVIAHGMYGLALAAAGDNDAAITEFRIVLQARPDDVEMRCNLGVLLQRQGKPAEAIEQFKTATRLDPTAPKPANLLKAALAKQNIQ